MRADDSGRNLPKPSWSGGERPQLENPEIAFPISLTPMTNSRTAMITALCSASQVLSPSRISRERSPSAHAMTTGAATPMDAIATKTM